jgi:hypothetical protein
MAKRKGIIPAVNVADALSNSRTDDARNAFIRSGRGTTKTSSPEPTPQAAAPRGRPALKRKVKPFPAKIWQDDALRISQLQLSWQLQTESSTQVSMTGIIRSLISASLPMLEEMDAPASEEQLMTRLAELLHKK